MDENIRGILISNKLAVSLPLVSVDAIITNKTRKAAQILKNCINKNVETFKASNTWLLSESLVERKEDRKALPENCCCSEES